MKTCLQIFRDAHTSMLRYKHRHTCLEIRDVDAPISVAAHRHAHVHACIHAFMCASVCMQTKIYGHVYIELYKLMYDIILYVRLHNLM